MPWSLFAPPIECKQHLASRGIERPVSQKVMFCSFVQSMQSTHNKGNQTLWQLVQRIKPQQWHPLPAVEIIPHNHRGLLFNTCHFPKIVICTRKFKRFQIFSPARCPKISKKRTEKQGPSTTAPVLKSPNTPAWAIAVDRKRMVIARRTRCRVKSKNAPSLASRKKLARGARVVEW